MELSIEQHLQQQARMQRLIHQQHRLLKQRHRDRINPQAQSIGFDAVSGSDLIQLADGSIVQTASLTNGVRGTGSIVQLHQGVSGMAVDQMPTTKRTLPQSQSKPESSYTFWVLWGNYLMKWVCKGKIATISLITKATSYPTPYEKFHNTQSGLCRISNSEFYIPYYHRLAKYNIQNLTGQTLLGQEYFDYTSYTIQGIHATYTLPSKDYLFSVEMRNTEDLRIYHINSLGAIDYTTVVPSFDPEAEVWSIAAQDTDKMYFVFYYGIFAKYVRTTNNLIYLFTTVFESTPSLFGSVIGGDPVEEITYAFMDHSDKSCYIVGVIIDSGVPGLQYSYSLNNIVVTGIAPETTIYGNDLVVVQADFPPGIVNPGDYVNTNSGFRPGYVYRVINDNTVYCILLDSNTQPYGYQFSGHLETGHRHFRTVIWKLDNNLNLSVYYRFPTIDNRQQADGYRMFYNGPCRSALIDEKTKDIYMYAQRRDVIVNGAWQRNVGEFDKGNLVKITKSKQLVVLKNKFDSSMSLADQNSIKQDWQVYDVQLETVFK